MDTLQTEDIAQSTTANTFNQKKAWIHFAIFGAIMIAGTIIVFCTQLGGSSVLFLVDAIFKTDTMSDPNLLLISQMLPMYLIAMPLFMLLFLILPKGQIVNRKMNFFHYLTIFPFAMFLTVFCNFFGVLFTTVVSMIKGSEVDNTLLNALDGVWLGWIFLFVVVCAPVFEELVFRKFIVSRTVKYGEAIPVLLSGVLFGLFHGNVNQFVYAFALGVLFAYIYVRTGKIIYTILLHMFVNFVGSFLALLAMQHDMMGFVEIAQQQDVELLTEYISANPENVLVIGLYWLVLYSLLGIGFLVAVAAIVLLIIRLVKKEKPLFDRGEITIPWGRKLFTVLVNPGMIIYILFWLVMMIVQLFA